MFIVTVQNADTKFWMRGTTWSFDAKRADVFATKEEAIVAIEKAKKFMRLKTMATKVVIERKGEI